MFKGTKRHPKGEFSEFISEVGGMENAFTGNDFTAYFQQIAKQHLKACMAFEADRMTGLTLTDDIVAPERDVVLEERRMPTPIRARNSARQSKPPSSPITPMGSRLSAGGMRSKA
jgi:zinc protease